MCVTEQGQETVDWTLERWREPIVIHFQPGTDGEFSSLLAPQSNTNQFPSSHDYWMVAQYDAPSLADLKKLLSRFPTGTTFSFPSGMLTDAVAEQRLFDDLQQSLVQHGMKLVKSPPRE